MTEQQYHQLLDNQRVRGARPALDAELASSLLTSASAARRRRLAAEAAWERLAAPEWRDRAAIDSVSAGTLTVAVADQCLCTELRASRLGRSLARAVPGVINVRFIVQGADEARPTEQYE